MAAVSFVTNFKTKKKHKQEISHEHLNKNKIAILRSLSSFFNFFFFFFFCVVKMLMTYLL